MKNITISISTKEKKLEKISDLTKYVLVDIPKPTEKDKLDLNLKKNLEGKSFENFLKEKILVVIPSITKKKVEKIVNIYIESAFKSDILYNRYINEEIDFDDLNKANTELSRIIGAQIESVLSPKEFKKIEGAISESIGNNLATKVASLFPATKWNVKSFDELCEYIDLSTLERVVVICKYRERSIARQSRKFIKDEISFKVLKHNIRLVREEYKKVIKKLLSEHQEKILFEEDYIKNH